MNAILVGTGLVLCWLAARLYYEWPFLRRPRLSAVGTVVDHRDISGEGGNSTLLIIRFEADDGQTVEITGSVGPWSHEIAKGSTIGVEYPPDSQKEQECSDRVRLSWIHRTMYFAS
jgi:hypothetical protein